MDFTGERQLLALHLAPLDLVAAQGEAVAVLGVEDVSGRVHERAALVKDVRDAARRRRDLAAGRPVGIHLGGYHDAQFTPAIPDWSEPARRAFAESGETNYAAFLKRQPMELQEDLARHVREAFGKDLVMVRWCMAAFGPTFTSSHDIREFADSKELDAIAPQVGYGERTPGFPVG